MTLLLLAGTKEARDLAGALSGSGIGTIAALSGATREPADLGVPTMSGGFGGEDGFRTFLNNNAITAILDATHPFAWRISGRTARVAAQLQIPYVQLLRPGWTPQSGDNWTMVNDETEVADHVPEGSVVFLATGRQSLPGFANLSGRTLICRQIDPPDGEFPYPNGKYLIGRPPFSVEDEEKLFSELGIDFLVVKNAGGTASETKLTAARNLKLPVIMLNRPEQPQSSRVETVKEAMNWVRELGH